MNFFCLFFCRFLENHCKKAIEHLKIINIFKNIKIDSLCGAREIL